MTEDQRIKIQQEAVRMLRTVFDPEIPVDIYSLGLIYRIDVDDDANLEVDMTLTAPQLPGRRLPRGRRTPKARKYRGRQKRESQHRIRT